MSNLPSALRKALSDRAMVGSLTQVNELKSVDGTIKRVYECIDGSRVEAVLMPSKDGRQTACLSSQVGCAMGCKFCATGQMGIVRSLSRKSLVFMCGSILYLQCVIRPLWSDVEIFEQAYRFAHELQAKGLRLSNVVMMGMGEPLANYSNVIKACSLINSELGVGARHITISTVGVVPKIKALAAEPLQFTLAVSLHSASDQSRYNDKP